MMETIYRIEPVTLESVPGPIGDAIADLSAAAAVLAQALHPATARHLAEMVRIMNSYYSNLIEGHHTRPRDIERALAGDLEADETRRDLQIESAAHVRVQAWVDRLAATGDLPEPASRDFVSTVHRQFYKEAPASLLAIASPSHTLVMEPGAWRSTREHNVAVGRHIPPSSDLVPEYMARFEDCYRLAPLGTARRLIAMAAAHHRFNYIHPFLDGNGRVSRLMSHAMAYKCGIGAHGLWSVSRGLDRGLESRTEYRSMMDKADTPRQGDLDGRGNLSLHALEEFVLWFLRICLDQVTFMSGLFGLGQLGRRFHALVAQSTTLRPETEPLLKEALVRGEFERGEASRITGLPERSARRVLNDTLAEGLLASETPKGAVSLRFPTSVLDILFPRLYPQA